MKKCLLIAVCLCLLLCVTALADEPNWNRPSVIIYSSGDQDCNRGTWVDAGVIGQVISVNDEVGGWFQMIAPQSGDYRFTVMNADIADDSMSIVIHVKNGDCSSKQQTWLSYERSASAQTRVFYNVQAGDVLQWWNACGQSGYTLTSSFKMMITLENTPTVSVTTTAPPTYDYSWLSVGDQFTFGSYEQDANSLNGREEILWTVLDIDSSTGYLLAMSNYGLDTMPYHNNNGYTRWGETDVRYWLNNTFLANFTSEEKKHVVLSSVSGSLDYFFLLDETQLKRYLKKEPYYCYATDYAKLHGAYVNDKSGASSWLLRMDATSNRIAWVGGGGKAYSSTGSKGVNYLTTADNVVRPVMWFSTKALDTTGIYAITNQKIATRSGPATEYTELNSYFNGGGEKVRVISRAHDGNIWWVEIEFMYNSQMVRVFTGLKRLDQSTFNFESVPVESVQTIAQGEVLSGAVAYYGPGTNYKTMTKKLTPAAGTKVTVIKKENGWYCLQYYSGKTICRVWMPTESVRLY